MCWPKRDATISKLVSSMVSFVIKKAKIIMKTQNDNSEKVRNCVSIFSSEKCPVGIKLPWF